MEAVRPTLLCHVTSYLVVTPTPRAITTPPASDRLCLMVRSMADTRAPYTGRIMAPNGLS